MLLAAAFAFALAAAPAAPVARAAPAEVPAALLQKLAESDARLSHLYETGSYVVTTRFQNLDPATGAVQKTNDIVTRMFTRDGKPWEEITKYVEAGKDITAARAALREKELLAGKRKRVDEIPFHGPFAATEQSKYRFTDGGADPKNAARRRILFAPKTATRETSVGEALVDPEEGCVRSMTLRPAVTPSRVRKIEYFLEFAAETPLGPALSSVRVEADGGVLFVRRRVHVETTLEDYAPAPPKTP